MTRYYEHNLIVTATREDGSAAEYSVAPDSALIDSDLGPANSIEEAKLIIEDAIGDDVQWIDQPGNVQGGGHGAMFLADGITGIILPDAD